MTAWGEACRWYSPDLYRFDVPMGNVVQRLRKSSAPKPHGGPFESGVGYRPLHGLPKLGLLLRATRDPLI